MQLGMVGLGRMGTDMVRRLMTRGHDCVVYDLHPEAIKNLEDQGAIGASSFEDLMTRLATPRVVWLMVPAAVVDQALALLVPLLKAGDVVIDGGNSYYRDDIRRGTELGARGVRYIDVGTSGGVAGFERGYCLMIGGEKDIVQRLAPIFATLAPAWRRLRRRRGERDAAAPPTGVICIAGRKVPATSSRWSTTASNTVSWRHMPKD
jgi:6-phosphogluconate dehydrogenase